MTAGEEYPIVQTDKFGTINFYDNFVRWSYFRKEEEGEPKEKFSN